MIKIDCADALTWLKSLPDNHVHCCVTSPPYYNLRDYQIEGQIGLEQTPQKYLDNLVNIFHEVKRVLRDDGVLFCNMGDTYYGGGHGKKKGHEKNAQCTQQKVGHGWNLKPKDLMGMPWRLALALQDDGWWLRSDIIWHKPSVLPESVRDRPTKCHEYIFLLTKNKKYYYDADAIREPIKETSQKRLQRAVSEEHKNINGVPGQTPHTLAQPRPNINYPASNVVKGLNAANERKPKDKSTEHKNMNVPGRQPHTMHKDRLYTHESANPHTEAGTLEHSPTWTPAQRFYHPQGRNKRTIWTVASSPFRGAHFATFPEKLIIPCILASTSEVGCCVKCGAPWKRISKRSGGSTGKSWNDHIHDAVEGQKKCAAPYGDYKVETLGWEPTCKCSSVEIITSLTENNCLQCGTPYQPVFENYKVYDHTTTEAGKSKEGPYANQTGEGEGTHDIRHGVYNESKIIHYQAICACNLPITPCTVMDPFMGSGTTSVVAKKLGRSCIGCDLNPEYVNMANKRLETK